MKKLNKIKENPYNGKPLSNKIKNRYSVRVRNFRIIYKIVDKEIRIYAIGNRDDIYKLRVFKD